METHFYENAALLAELSGYAHDKGKTSVRFQKKLLQVPKVLKSEEDKRLFSMDRIRHEWISSKLYAMGIQSPETLTPETFAKLWEDLKEEHDRNDNPECWKPNSGLNAMGIAPAICHSIDDVVQWIIATHHGGVGGSIKNQNQEAADSSEHIRDAKRFTPVLKHHNPEEQLFMEKMPKKTTEDYKRWEDLFRKETSVRQRLTQKNISEDAMLALQVISRAALVLADHMISSLMYSGKDQKNVTIFANCREENGKRFGNQPLSWHMLGVGEQAAKNIRMFDAASLPGVDESIRSRILGARSGQHRFGWQDKAVDTLMDTKLPTLVFNMAGTGSGKTRANLKMALAMNANGRVIMAANLRSLTKQTAEAYRTQVGMTAEEYQKNVMLLMGEEGSSPLEADEEIADTTHRDADNWQLEGFVEQAPEWMQDIPGDNREQLVKMMVPPVLVCTVDWIVAAGEPCRQGHHAKALVRLANSDLVLDEVDSYDTKALVSILRLVFMAGMLGRNVIVSSATMNARFRNLISEVYYHGNRHFQGAHPGCPGFNLAMVSDRAAPSMQVITEMETMHDIMSMHVAQLCSALVDTPSIHKRFQIQPVENEDSFSQSISVAIDGLHNQWKTEDPRLPGKRLSIGLVRMANVEPTLEVSEALRKSGKYIVTTYHARELGSRRYLKEKHLDAILQRHPGQDIVAALMEAHPVLKDPDALASMPDELCFVVVATPVEEVGRDHDFDWAVVEPSSMHSILQTIGRVNRHRLLDLQKGQWNVVILDRNWKSLRSSQNRRKGFYWPGFEVEVDGRSSHGDNPSMRYLLAEEGKEDLPVLVDFPIDARFCLATDENGNAKVRFARFDEEAIRVFLKEIPDIFAGNKHGAFWMKEFQRKFPLRGRGNLQLDVDWKNKAETFSFWKNGTLQTERKIFWEPGNLENTWMSWDHNTIQQQVSQEAKDHIPFPLFADEAMPRKVTIAWNGVLKKS